MRPKKPRTILYRRKREGRTNYTRRLKLLLSRKPRLVVRLTNQRVIAQLVQFTPKGDQVLVGADSFALKKLGWTYSCKNIPAMYLTGLLLAKKAIEKGHKLAILDVGLRNPKPRGKTYSFLKGVIDGGLTIPHGEEKIFPIEERLTGKHIHLKSGSQPEDITKLFETLKQKVSA